MKQRIIHATEQGNFVVLTLQCRHSIRKRTSWWSRHRLSIYNAYEACPQCSGYKH